MGVFATYILNTDIFDLIEKVLATIGLISAVLTVLRFFHNSRAKTWSNNVSITDHPSNYDIESVEKNPIYSKIWHEDDYTSIIVFKAVGTIIKKLQVISLDFSNESSDFVETEIIEEFENVSPDQAICFRLERAETIPKLRLKWFCDYGEYAIHNFSDNLRNGINDVNGVEYESTFSAKIRKALGFI